MKRKALSQKTRFEVFKRDKFTCQYCGAKAPDVVLQVDHIEAVANGGGNEILNLLTSCKGCNGGKSATPISDGSAVERQRQQLADLEERRQQIELMVQWKTELASQDDALIAALDVEFDRKVGYRFSPIGEAKVAKAMKRVGFSLLFDALGLSAARNIKLGQDGKITKASSNDVFEGMLRIANSMKNNGSDPDGSEFAYIQGILRNRTGDRYLKAFDHLRNWRNCGMTVEEMTEIAKEADNWEVYKDDCEAVCAAIAAQRRASAA